ncbi:MAG: TonB-dependent receptor [Ignavibacteriales bacterium]|nr:TonB-dependent receptor [Ignavibacteriales bacterium]
MVKTKFHFYRRICCITLAVIVLHVIFSNMVIASVEGRNLRDIKITLDAVDVTLEKILQMIEDKTNFKFFYIKEEIPLNEKATIKVNNESMYRLLVSLAKDYGLEFKRVNNQIVVKKSTNANINNDRVGESTIKINGKVIDSSNGESLPGASISIENTQSGTIANFSGEFELDLNEIPSVILVSYVGYKTERIIITTNDSTYAVPLTPVSYMLQEVSVFSRQSSSEISLTSIRNEQVNNFAGFTKDALRSVQLFPGVSNNNEGTALFNVRGGTFDENLVLVNGVEIYSPFHLKAMSPMGVGIFNIDLVKNIDFSSGGYSAEYGNALSSIMNLEYDKGNNSSYSGRVDLSMIDLSLLLRGPLTSKGSFAFALRHSYLDMLMRSLHADVGINLSYYDLQGTFNYKISDSDIVTTTLIFSKDKDTQDPTTDYYGSQWLATINKQRVTASYNGVNYRVVDANYHNTLLATKYDKIFSPRFSAHTILSLYDEAEYETMHQTKKQDYTYQNFPDLWAAYRYYANYLNQSDTKTLSAKQTFIFAPSPFYTIKTGFSYKRILYDLDKNAGTEEYFSDNINYNPTITTIYYPKNPLYNDTADVHFASYRTEGFIENIIQPLDNLVINAGFRSDYFALNKQAKFSPRLNLSYTFPQDFILRLSWGVYYQPPTFKQLKYYEPSAANTPYAKAIHFVAGVERNFSSDLFAKIEFYYKKYSDLLPVSRMSDGSLQYFDKQNSAEGSAAGFDFQMIAKFSPCDLWLNYGFLNAREKLYAESEYYPRYTDQRHTLSAVLNAHLGSMWESSIRFFYGSGYAFTPYGTSYNPSKRNFEWVPLQKNSDHYPSYVRFDLRLSKSFELFNNLLNIYIDVLNIFGKRNVLSFNYTYNSSTPVRKDNPLLPILPSLGILYNF